MRSWRGQFLGVATVAWVVGVSALAAQQAAAPLPAGDLVIGKGLFTGAIRFQNAGPPCMACHSIAGIGALGGGALGPDLTGAYAKFGEVGLAAILSNMPFPTMRPIFSPRPITPEEQDHLLAFLRQTVPERPRGAVAQLVLLTLVGAVVLLAPMPLVWRRRLTAVRRPLVGRARESSEEKRG